MSKPIRLTDELIEQIKQDFATHLETVKMFDGNVEFSQSISWTDDENTVASVTFTPAAYAKMVSLLQNFSSEVAWHGVTYRDEADESNFIVTDILVYPQVVSGATVETDQAEYTKWLYELEDEEFNNLRMQGHSHVNMAVTPSSVDLAHQEKILAQADDDMFYIFMIWNKSLASNIKIFDLANNILYENEDIDVFVGSSKLDLSGFVKDAKTSVKTASFQKAAPVNQKAATANKWAPASKQNKGGGRFAYDDYDDPYGPWNPSYNY